MRRFFSGRISGAKALLSWKAFSAWPKPCPETKPAQSVSAARLILHGSLGRIVISCVAVCLVAALSMGAADNGARFDHLGSEMMCTCGCGQVLLQCNHYECPALAREGGELKAAVDRGESDNAILISFQNEYGPTVLAAPMLTKFNMIAWIVPPLFLILGILGTVELVRRWRKRVAAMPAVEHDAEFEAIREKVRKDTEL